MGNLDSFDELVRQEQARQERESRQAAARQVAQEQKLRTQQQRIEAFNNLLQQDAARVAAAAAREEIPQEVITGTGGFFRKTGRTDGWLVEETIAMNSDETLTTYEARVLMLSKTGELSEAMLIGRSSVFDITELYAKRHKTWVTSEEEFQRIRQKLAKFVVQHRLQM